MPDDRKELPAGALHDAALAWCAPVICDVLRQFYAQAGLHPGLSVAGLADMHVQSWLELVAGNHRAAIALQESLTERVIQAGMDAQMVDAANHAVLSEITDVIMSRFRRPSYSKADYAQALLDAGERLLRQKRRPA